eukprot:466611_1
MPSLIALGPEDAWVVQDDTKFNDISWSSGLPDNAFNVLNGCDASANNKNNALKIFAMGDNDDYFVSYINGDWQYSGIPDLDDALFKSDVSCFALGPNSSYITITDACVAWNNVPSEADKILKKKSSQLVWASLGCDDTYFFMFADGSYCWDVSASLNKILLGCKRINKLYLCASSENYFIQYGDGSVCWSVSVSFCNKMEVDQYMSPGEIAYLNSSIKNTFSCGTPIQVTMEGLKSKQIAVEDIPAVHVVKYKDVVYSLNNRRLWAFKNSGIGKIPVILKKPDALFISLLNKKLYCDIQIR